MSGAFAKYPPSKESTSLVETARRPASLHDRFAIAFLDGARYFLFMPIPLDAFISDGRVVISFPEAAVPPRQREDFIAFLKTEWVARQSRLTATEAKTLADEVDANWWSRNRQDILRRIGET